VGKFSDNQWNLLHQSFSHPEFGALLPCSRTITRHWNAQKGIEPTCIDAEFFASRMIMDITELEEEDNHINEPISVTFHVDFLFWYDGAKLYGGHKGLLSAIKILLVDMIPTLSRPIPIDLYQFARHFIRRLDIECFTSSRKCS